MVVKERILILAKTYPSPSKGYVETSCVAGINEDGVMRRMYPVPFRLIESGQKFQKWQWITANIEKARGDHREESHKIAVDTINCENLIETKGNWFERYHWLDKVPTYSSIAELNKNYKADKKSLVLLAPKKFTQIEIKPAKQVDWTEDQKEALRQQYRQTSLFQEDDAKSQMLQLEKIPFDFYLHFDVEVDGVATSEKMKVIDWEIGALFLNCRKGHGSNWERPFKEKMDELIFDKDLHILVGNQHRFQNQWLIISLIYPPKRTPGSMIQDALF